MITEERLDNADCVKRTLAYLKRRCKGLVIRTKQRVFAILLVLALSVNLSSTPSLQACSKGAVLLIQHCAPAELLTPVSILKPRAFTQLFTHLWTLGFLP